MPSVYRNRPQYAVREHDREAGQSASYEYRVGLLSEVYFQRTHIK